jgi:UDP-N-acetylglucosamine 2-epimerase (non-hydrolysing)
MAPVVIALRKLTGLTVRVILTGQHRDLPRQALRTFGISEDQDLGVMRENQSLAGLTARLIEALDAAVCEEHPDLVIAQGDTTSVMVAALAAFYRGVPFAHVEAGLRTGNLNFPFPEELDRIVAGRIARLNFAPTDGSKQALLAEGIPSSTIFVTGNTVIDALFHVASRVGGPSIALPPDRRIVLLTMHRRESFGEPMRSVMQAVQQVAAIVPDVHFVYPVHPNPNVRALACQELGRNPAILLTEPLDYVDLIATLKRSAVVLTDSGGLQEEAPALGKPVLVLRAETERPEAVQAGVAKLVGTRTDVIVAELSRLLTDESAYNAMARGVSPYGDGKAAVRIARVVREFLG